LIQGGETFAREEMSNSIRHSEASHVDSESISNALSCKASDSEAKLISYGVLNAVIVAGDDLKYVMTRVQIHVKACRLLQHFANPCRLQKGDNEPLR
jgi:hypothetical protein